LLPLIRRELSTAASAADTANFSRPDSVRAVRMNYRVTNGKSGTEERIRDTAYVFGVAAQDCTPAFSSIVTANITFSVP